MSKDWVDFKAVKEAVTMEMVLARHYNIGLRKVNRDSLRGNCPLPTHSQDATEDSFAVNTEKNAWACQSASCRQGRDGRTGGNILDFVAVMENCTIRDAALKIQEWFHVEATNDRPEDYVRAKDRPKPKKKLATEKKDEAVSPPSDTRVGESDKDTNPVNPPLEFQLKSIDLTHPYIRKRGLKPETAEHFGIGHFHGRGSMAERLVIPIHNEQGELIAYVGRAIDTETDPKYKLPAGFKKSLVLFNLHRVLEANERKTVIVVEGYFDSFKIHQAGFPNVAALMGCELSEYQEKLLVDNFERIVVMLDNDKGGNYAATQIVARLMDKAFVRLVHVPEAKQTDQLSVPARHPDHEVRTG